MNYIDKWLNILLNAKEHDFDSKQIVRELHDIQRLEKRKNRLKSSCEIYSKQLQKYKDMSISLFTIIRMLFLIT